MRYKILFQACPIWKVGERDVDAEARRVRQDDLAASERYPQDYAGRVISVIPDTANFSKADLADPSRMVMARDLSGSEATALRDHASKVIPSRDGFEFVDASFDDRWGAVADVLRANISDVETAESGDRDEDIDARRFDEIALLAKTLLPVTEVHTGAGLYEVGPGKTYSTIQSALDQLYTDQGSGAFTSIQYIRIFADTYDENVAPNSNLTPINGYALVIEGDPAVSRDTILLQPSGGIRAIYLTNDGPTVIRHLKLDGTNVSSEVVRSSTAVDHLTVEDCRINGNSNWVVYLQGVSQNVLDCHISSSVGNGTMAMIGDGVSYAARCLCTFGGAKGTTVGILLRGGRVESCVCKGFNAGIQPQQFYNSISVVNTTIYDCNYGIRMLAPSASVVRVFNNIISNVINVIRYGVTNGWPDETTLGTVGNSFIIRNNVFHSYTDFADDGIDQRTYAQFIALDRVDAADDLDQTDPLMTDPANEDFSLQSGSPCRNAGHGVAVVTDYLGVGFDINEPDIGAWSSGALPPPTIPDAPTITAIANDGDGASATASVLTETGSKVFLLSRQRNSAEAWTVRGSRTGSGDIAATGFTNNANYESIAIATFGTLVTENPSLPSIPVGVYITDSAGFFAAIRQAIYDWVSGELGIPTIWYQPNAPQPARPCAAINKGPTQSPRWDYKSPPDAVNGVSTLRGDREFPVEIQIHGRKLPDFENEALTLAEQLGTSLQKGSITALFNAANFAFVERIALTDISAIGGTEFESRVSLELMFRMAHEDTDTVGVIETVDPVGATYE